MVSTFERDLKETGLDVQLCDRFGVSLLHRLAGQGMTELMAALIERLHQTKSSLSITDTAGLTALYFAAGRGIKTSMELLIKIGANPSARDRHGN